MELIIAIITACGGAAVTGLFAVIKSRKAEKSEICKKLDDMDFKLEAHINEDAECKAIESRSRILAFGDETRRGLLHTKETWDDLLKNIDRYEDYCTAHPLFENNQAVQTIDYLKALYKTCLKKNSFL